MDDLLMEKESLRALIVMLKASTNVTNMLKKDMDSYGLNTTEFMVLELLYSKGPQAIQMIGKKVLLASSSITYVINQLEEKTLVKRNKNEKDRRVTLVSLTLKGEELMNKIFPEHSLIIQQLFEHLSAEELANFSENIKRIGYKAVEMNDNFEEYR